MGGSFFISTLPPPRTLRLSRDDPNSSSLRSTCRSTQPGIEFETIVTILGQRGYDLRGWGVDPALMFIPIDLGAGQYRAVGRMLGLYQIGEIKDRVRRKEAALMTPGAAAQLGELTGIGRWRCERGPRSYSDCDGYFLSGGRHRGGDHRRRMRRTAKRR